MADGKNQHFVPQRYFRQFSEDRRSIQTFLKHSGRHISGAPIRGQASKAWYYGDKSIEDAITQVESLGGDALDFLRTTQDLTRVTVKLFGEFLIWVVLQRARTEAARNASRNSDNEVMRMALKVGVNNMEDLGMLFTIRAV